MYFGMTCAHLHFCLAARTAGADSVSQGQGYTPSCVVKGLVLLSRECIEFYSSSDSTFWQRDGCCHVSLRCTDRPLH